MKGLILKLRVPKGPGPKIKGPKNKGPGPKFKGPKFKGPKLRAPVIKWRSGAHGPGLIRSPAAPCGEATPNAKFKPRNSEK